MAITNFHLNSGNPVIERMKKCAPNESKNEVLKIIFSRIFFSQVPTPVAGVLVQKLYEGDAQ